MSDFMAVLFDLNRFLSFNSVLEQASVEREVRRLRIGWGRGHNVLEFRGRQLPAFSKQSVY